MPHPSGPFDKPSLRRKWEAFLQKRELACAQHPLRTSLPFLGVSAALLTAAVIGASCTVCYQVESQGEGVVYFQDQAAYQAAVARAEDRAAQILQTPYPLEESLSVKPAVTWKTNVQDESGITGSLLETIPEIEHVYTLSVDGQSIGAVEDQATITQALDLVKQAYTTDETRSVHIESQVDIRYEYLPIEAGLCTAESLAQVLLEESPQTFPYTVQEGDTMESLLQRFAMDEETFRALNPDLTLESASQQVTNPFEDPADLPAEGDQAEPAQTQEETPEETGEETGTEGEDALADQIRTPLTPGEEITIQQLCPRLVVTTVEEMDIQREKIPQVVVQEDPSMYAGQQRIIQEGKPGQETVLSRVTTRCGVPIAGQELGSVTQEEADALIIAAGSKENKPWSWSDGSLYLWPVQGTISSEFGYRYIFGGSNFHRGLDIAAPSGTAILAAADGKVIFSGVKGTYGNLVAVDHGNGFVTYYGHCSQLIAQVGDEVKRGDVIAAVGSTGRSTGPHCHFEVRYENTPVDPLLYLPEENTTPASTVSVQTQEAGQTQSSGSAAASQQPAYQPEPEQPTLPEEPEEPTLPQEPETPEDPALPEDQTAQPQTDGQAETP